MHSPERRDSSGNDSPGNDSSGSDGGDGSDGSGNGGYSSPSSDDSSLGSPSSSTSSGSHEMLPPPPMLERAEARRNAGRIYLMYSRRYMASLSQIQAHQGRDELLTDLMSACGLAKWLSVRPPAKAGRAHLFRFHAEDFVDTLFRADPANADEGGGGDGDADAEAGSKSQAGASCQLSEGDDMETEDGDGDSAASAVPLATLDEYGLVDDCEVSRCSQSVQRSLSQPTRPAPPHPAHPATSHHPDTPPHHHQGVSRYVGLHHLRRRRVDSGGGPPLPWRSRRRHQLGRRSPPCAEGRGRRLLLQQRLRHRDPLPSGEPWQ